MMADALALLLPGHGPMARTVGDVSLAFSILAGSHWSDPSSVPVPVTDPVSVDVDQLRVAAVEQIGPETAGAETLDALRRAVAAFEACGVEVEWVESVPGDDRIHEYAVAGQDRTGGAAIESVLGRMRSSVDQLHRLTRLTYDVLAEHHWTLEGSLGTLTEILMLRAEIRRFFDRHDVLLSPVAADPAPRHGEAWNHFRGMDYCRVSGACRG